MQIHSVQHTGTRQSVENHCPHGRVGGCAECNPSGGGGGGGGVKRNTSGLMTWNQAWAVWNALQVANARQKDYLKGLQNNQSQVQHEAAAVPNRLVLAVVRFLQTPGMQTIASSLNAAVRNLTQFSAALQNGVKTVLQTLSRGLENINIADKIATLLGDAKKLLDDILHNNLESLKGILARFRFAERLAQVSQLMEKMLKTMASEASQWIRDVGERVQELFERFNRWFSRKPKEDRRKRHNSK